jgi:hypothetical protein
MTDSQHNAATLKRLAGVIRNHNNRAITAWEAMKDIERIVLEEALAERARREKVVYQRQQPKREPEV